MMPLATQIEDHQIEDQTKDEKRNETEECLVLFVKEILRDRVWVM